MTINELIKELKITNITHAKLKDVCIFERGSYINQKEAESGDIPVISGGAIPIGFTNKFNRDYPCVSISSVGYAGENIYFWDRKIWAYSCITLIPKDSQILNVKYLYYFILSIKNKLLHIAHGFKKSFTNIYPKDLYNLDIYFPSLPYQQQIVKILDEFTELEAELEARKKQYDYWLNFLYNPEVNLIIKNYSTIKLESICIFERGKSVNKKLLEEGLIPIVSSGVEPIGFTSQVNRNGEWISVATSRCGAGKNIYYWNAPFYASDCLTIRSNDEHKLLTKYLYYFLLTKRNTLILNVSEGAIPHIYARNFYNLLINLPSIDYQQKIVSILDQFNNLTSNLQDGIPAEIKLRKDQYHYYLKQLLCFDKQLKID